MKVESCLAVPQHEDCARYHTSAALVLEAFVFFYGVLRSVGRQLFTEVPGKIIELSASVLSA